MSKVRIELSNHATGKIWIDDVEVQNVTRIMLIAGVNRRNRVRIEVLAKELEVTCLHSDTKKFVTVPVIAEDSRKDN